jgi:hypothetical protein
MRLLFWKEFRENLKWTAVPMLLILGPTALFGSFELMNDQSLFYIGLISALFGAALGFVQFFFESSGDKRSLLLHRPLSRTRIFLGKALAGVALYLLGVGVPFGTAVVLAATPGHTYQPFGWPMVLPWLADALTGLVFYFAGVLTAQREARWYGSRCLGLATGLFASLVVWTVPEFWQALVAIVILGGLAAVAAWGSFGAGGAYAPQPRLARIALAGTFLAGLLALDFTGKCFVALWLTPKGEYTSHLDRQGRALRVHFEDGEIVSVIDLAGNLPPALRDKRLGRYELKHVKAPSARGPLPRLRSYRNRNRYLVEHTNKTKPGVEAWWYVPERGRLLGYDKKSKRFIGSFGPAGYARPDEPAGDRFQGELDQVSFMYMAFAPDYLAFPGGVYQVDFSTLAVRTLFVPPAGETVRWASEWEDDKQKTTLAFVGTDRAVYAVNEAGSRVFTAPLAYDPETYPVKQVGRLDNPERFWVWYQPAWYLGVERLETMSDHVVIYDRAGREVPPRQDVPPRPGGPRDIRPSTLVAEASPVNAVLGLATPITETAVLAATERSLESEVRANGGTETPLTLRFLIVTAQFFVPGLRWDPRAHAGLVAAFATLTLLSAAVCALAALLLSRRYAFARVHCLGWSLCGFLFGPTGLLLLVVLHDWPARVTCPGCGKPRLVTRAACEHCGAEHARPAADGTEIFEESEAALQPN